MKRGLSLFHACVREGEGKERRRKILRFSSQCDVDFSSHRRTSTRVFASQITRKRKTKLLDVCLSTRLWPSNPLSKASLFFRKATL